ncbi:MAG: hypothetical protein JNM33_03085 [Rubrivivax sp.]|nr:hypothetical protein [Rubrivivax sp.]
MNPVHLVPAALALSIAFSPQARAALVTFDLSGSALVGTSVSFFDRSGHYTLTARGVSYNTGLLDSSFQVTRDAEGLGVRALGDTSDFIELNGPNDRLRLELGTQRFSLRGLYVSGDLGDNLFLYLGGEGDTTRDELRSLARNNFVNLNSGPLGVLDFAGGGNGIKLVSISFETGVPLPEGGTPLPLPSTAALALLALGAGAAARRSSP